jgi:hypothetical protein
MGSRPLKSVPSAQIYAKLAAGPNWQREYEIQPNVPVDGSNAALRDPTYGSPFTLRIMPPEPLVNALNTTGDGAQVRIIDSARAEFSSSFREARDRIANLRASTFVSTNEGNLKQLEALIAGNGVLFDPSNSRQSQANVPAISDLTQAANVILQLNRALQAPPLTMLINPEQLNISYGTIQNYSERNRYGYIFQRWGEQQVRLSISGKTGAFIAGAKSLVGGTNQIQNFGGLGAPSAGGVQQTPVVTGVQWAAKRDSASWQNLMSLLTFYRNNGYIYDNLEQTEAMLFVGSVAIDYDQNTWIGHFENFEWQYDENKQMGGIEFSFEFIADYIYDNAQQEFQVLPIAAPTPSPSDPLWIQKRQQQSRPGAFRVNSLTGALAGDSIDNSNATGIFSPFNT